MQTTLDEGKFLKLVKEHNWEYVQRIPKSSAVAIVAVTQDRKVLFVEQYRIPVAYVEKLLYHHLLNKKPVFFSCGHHF